VDLFYVTSSIREVRKETALIAMVQSDMTALGQNENTFGCFSAFSFEVFDPNGRFLAFINRDQPHSNNPVRDPSPRTNACCKKARRCRN
jgi:hypothetical protein